MVGIIGGIGPESTIDYYRSLVASYREKNQDGSYPSIIINSIDLNRLIGLIEANQLSEVTDYLEAEVQKLAAAGQISEYWLPARLTLSLMSFNADHSYRS